MPNLQFEFQRALRLQKEGRLSSSLEVCRQILAFAPNQLDVLSLCGVLAGQLSNFDAAVDYLDRLIAQAPRLHTAHGNRALALQALGRLDEALQSLDRAVALKSDYVLGHFNRGVVLGSMGRLEAAISSYDKAISLESGFAMAHFNRAVALQGLLRWDESLTGYGRAIALRPDYAEAYINRGSVLKAQCRFEAALVSFDKAAAIQPWNSLIFLNRGAVLMALDQPERALTDYDRALSLTPDYAEAFSNKGVALARIGRREDAIACYTRAIELNAALVDAYCGRGSALSDLGRIGEALIDYDRAIEIQPDCAQAHFNRALTELSLGNFAAGWVGHEWRWQAPASSSFKERRSFRQPLWLGKESIAGKTLLTHSEQGFGDTLQFCRYVPMLAELEAKVILEVPGPLVGLTSRMVGVSRVLSRGEPLPDVDYQCPLMSLPLAFGTRLENIPAPRRYLSADPERVANAEKILGRRTRPRIGLAWSGNATYINERSRRVPLSQLTQFLPAGFDYYCLQKDIRPSDQAVLDDHPLITNLQSLLFDFDDTAAFCECMDLLISSDTSVAHLGGALGQETWILVSTIGDWRWLRQRCDSPWYPSVTLYRQEKPADWSMALQKIQEDLLAKIAG